MAYFKHMAYLLILLSTTTWALPTLLTKQKVDDIRYIAEQGKHTYYQTKSGTLHYATNYTSIKLLDKEGSEYFIYDFPEKKLIIEERENYLSNFNIHDNFQHYLLKIGEEKPLKIGEGQNPALHHYDFYSRYDSKGKKVVFLSLKTKKEIAIDLKNQTNPFFIPQKEVVAPDTFLYTDINQEGISAIIQYNSLDKKFTTLYKAKYPGMRIEICLLKDQLLVGEFPLYNLELSSSIKTIPLFNNPNYQKQKTIYQSPLADLGSMLCTEEQEVYFIKTIEFNKDLNLKATEAAKLDLKNNQVSVISDLKLASQLIKMEKMILLPHKGTYYIVKGKNNKKGDALEK